MNDEHFNNIILDRIHNEHIQPRSRWYFVSERWFFITVIAIATAIGSIAVTTSLFVLTDHDWFAISYLEEGMFVHIIKTIPYLWLVVIGIALSVIYYNSKKIGRGYRRSSWHIIAWSLLGSIGIGALLFFAGAGNYLDRYFNHHIPSYRSLVSSNRTIWIYPEDGLLSGKIITTTADQFTLVDQDDQPWTVSTPPHTQMTAGTVAPNQYVKIIGVMTDGSDFTATTVLPWLNERK